MRAGVESFHIAMDCQCKRTSGKSNNSRIQGQVRCTLQDAVCIKCEDKSFLSPMSVDNFLKAVFESCYVVFVASHVVNLYTSFHHRMSLLS